MRAKCPDFHELLRKLRNPLGQDSQSSSSESECQKAIRKQRRRCSLNVCHAIRRFIIILVISSSATGFTGSDGCSSGHQRSQDHQSAAPSESQPHREVGSTSSTFRECIGRGQADLATVCTQDAAGYCNRACQMCSIRCPGEARIAPAQDRAINTVDKTARCTNAINRPDTDSRAASNGCCSIAASCASGVELLCHARKPKRFDPGDSSWSYAGRSTNQSCSDAAIPTASHLCCAKSGRDAKHDTTGCQSRNARKSAYTSVAISAARFHTNSRGSTPWIMDMAATRSSHGKYDGCFSSATATRSTQLSRINDDQHARCSHDSWMYTTTDCAHAMRNDEQEHGSTCTCHASWSSCEWQFHTCQSSHHESGLFEFPGHCMATTESQSGEPAPWRSVRCDCPWIGSIPATASRCSTCSAASSTRPPADAAARCCDATADLDSRKSKAIATVCATAADMSRSTSAITCSPHSRGRADRIPSGRGKYDAHAKDPCPRCDIYQELSMQTGCITTDSSDIAPGIFHVTSGTAPAQDSESCPRKHPFTAAARDWGGIACAFRQRVSLTNADPNRDCQYEWRRIGCIGMKSCRERRGPCAPAATLMRTTHAHMTPSPGDTPAKTNQGRVVLSLNELVSCSPTEAALHEVDSFVPQLSQSWPQTAMLRSLMFLELVPDLNLELRSLISQMPEWDGSPVEAVFIYVDGSSQTNRQDTHHITGAWAFIVILQTRHSDNVQFQFYAATCHVLCPEVAQANAFCGVGERNQDPLTAEAVGMIMAQAWVLQSPFQRPHQINFDNMTIGGYVSGKSRWNVNWEHSHIKTVLHTMSQCLRLQRKSVAYAHVKAHEGHPVNELADALAKATVKGCMPTLSLPACVSSILKNRHHHFMWLTQMAPLEVPKPAALKGTFLAEGPFHKRVEDNTWWPTQPEVHHDDVQICISFATANVLTLSPGTKRMQCRGLMQQGRIATLQNQFEAVSTHVIGVQEARTHGQMTRHSATHFVFQSGATKDSARGCELWLSRNNPYARSKHKQFWFQSDHVHIASFSDRHLFAILRAPHLHIRILVLHAPHQHATDVPYEEWWATIHAEVARIGTQLPLVVLGDLNARLGTVRSSAVDAKGAEEENLTGHLLHAFMVEKNLWAPSTFATCHSGISATWTSTDGQQNRLDYVLLPIQWKQFDIISQIQTEVDLCTIRDDHFVAEVRVQMSHSQSACLHTKRHHLDMRRCAQPSDNAAFQKYLQSPPVIPWSVGVGLHAEVLTAWLQKGAKQCFARTRDLPRQRYMSEFTWNIVQTRKELLKMRRQSVAYADALSLQVFFQAWRHESVTNHQPDFQIDTIRCRIQLARSHCLKNAAWASHHRYKLHTTARQASRQDRVACAKDLAEQFFVAAHHRNSQLLYRQLKPLLGQTFRRAIQPFRPIPAVQTPSAGLADSHEQAASCWQHHFAQPEGGISVTVEQLQELMLVQAPRYDTSQLPFDLNSLPNLADIEDYIHAAKPRKSPGIDGLPSEIFKIDAAKMSQLLWPLLRKCALRCTEPLRWRGGEVCALPKQRAAGFQPSHYRSILLADFTSKVWHGLVRRKLLPSLQTYKVSLQAGGLPGLSTDMLHLTVQSFAHLNHSDACSCAAVFVDIKQAFDRTLRPLLVQRHCTEEMLAKFFQEQGWHENMFCSFMRRLHERPALNQAQVSPHQAAQTNALLSTTWFQVRQHPRTLTSTDSGTRPGDSVADILFAFVMSRYLHQLRSQFQDHDLHNTFQLRWIPPGNDASEAFEPQRLIQACWVDDLVILLKDRDVDGVLHKTSQAAGIMLDLAVEFGLQLNFAKDKTAVALSLRGPGSRKAWQRLLDQSSDKPVIPFQCRTYSDPQHLDVVPDYVYLGQLQNLSGNSSVEINRRFLLVQHSCRLLRTNVFRSPHMPIDTKYQLWKALVLSKITYGAGAWQSLYIATARKWHTQMMNQYASLLPQLKRGPGVMHLDILATGKFCPPMLVLTRMRCSLFDRLMQTELSELFALLQQQSRETGWFAIILDDLARLTRVCPAHVVFQFSGPDAIAELGHFCFLHPRSLTKCCNWVHKLQQLYLVLWQQFRCFQKQLEHVLSQHGVTWIDPDEPTFAAESFVCDECQATFQSFKALCSHAYQRHTASNVAHKYASSNTCRGCLRTYHTPKQVIHHLKYMRTGCLAKLILTVPPLDENELAEVFATQREYERALKHADRTAVHRHPVCQSHGPQRP